MIPEASTDHLLSCTPLNLSVNPQHHRIVEVGRYLWKLPNAVPQLKAGVVRPGCLRPGPDGFK